MASGPLVPTHCSLSLSSSLSIPSGSHDNISHPAQTLDAPPSHPSLSQMTWPRTQQGPGKTSLPTSPPPAQLGSLPASEPGRLPWQSLRFLPQALSSLGHVLTSSSLSWRPQPLLSAVSLQNAPQSLSQDCPHLVSLPCQAPVGSSLHSLPLQPPFALQPAGAWPRPSTSSELPPWKYEGPQC